MEYLRDILGTLLVCLVPIIGFLSVAFLIYHGKDGGMVADCDHIDIRQSESKLRELAGRTFDYGTNGF